MGVGANFFIRIYREIFISETDRPEKLKLKLVKASSSSWIDSREYIEKTQNLLLRNRLARKAETYVELSSSRVDSSLFHEKHKNIQGIKNWFSF